MDLVLFGRYFLDFALLYPSAFLCLASLWEKLRTPRRTACIAAGCITLLCIGCAALCAVFTEIYSLSLHDALPISSAAPRSAPCSG